MDELEVMLLSAEEARAVGELIGHNLVSRNALAMFYVAQDSLEIAPILEEIVENYKENKSRKISKKQMSAIKSTVETHAYRAIRDKETLFYVYKHLRDHLSSINIFLSTYDTLPDRINQTELGGIMKQLKSAFRKDKISIDSSIEIDSKFNTEEALLYTALYSLVSNSYDAGAKKVDISFSRFSGQVPDPVYAAEGSPLENEFLKINVNDNGSGFPEDRPLNEFLDMDVTTKEYGGFGLHYVSLVCKYLRSHITIDSEKKNTNIAIYHPMNLKGRL